MTTHARNVRRRTAAVGALIAASTVLAGCTGGGSGSGGTELDIMVGAQDLPEEMIAEFEEANPGISINHIVYDETRLNTMLASNNPPDLVFGNASGSANNNARGLATDLTPYLAESEVLKEEDLPAVNDAFRWDGNTIGKGPLYGILKDWSHDNALWYNTALFDAAGIPYLSDTEPISYDELLEIAKKLTVVEGGTTAVYGLGMEWQWTLIGPISAMISSQGGELFSEDLTEVDFTTPEAQRALQWFVDFGQSGVGPTSLNPLPDGSDYSTFAAERMAITQDGYWYGGNFAADDALKTVRFAPAPTMGDIQVPMSYGGAGLWMPEGADDKDAAWTFMEYYMAGPPAQERASSGWGLPSLNSLTDLLPQDQPFQQQAYAVVQEQVKHSALRADSPYITGSLMQDTIDKYLQRAIKNELTVAEAGARMTDELNEALAQGVEQIGTGE